MLRPGVELEAEAIIMAEEVCKREASWRVNWSWPILGKAYVCREHAIEVLRSAKAAGLQVTLTSLTEKESNDGLVCQYQKHSEA